MKIEKQKRMLAILAGEVPLEEITEKELLFLQKRVMRAIQNKKAAEGNKLVVETPRTLQ